MGANDPQYVRTVLRERGMCGEISRDKKQACIMTKEHEGEHFEPGPNPKGYRSFTLDTVEQRRLRVKEVEDGADFAVYRTIISDERFQLTADQLVELANKIASWFMDETPAFHLAQVDASLKRVIELLDAYNAEAERMGGDFVPYQDMANHVGVARLAVEQLQKGFGKP